MHMHATKASETLRKKTFVALALLGKYRNVTNISLCFKKNPNKFCFVTFWCFPLDPNSSAAAVTPTLRRTLALLGESNILLENVTLAMGISTFLKRRCTSSL